MKNKIRILLTIALIISAFGIGYGFFNYFILGSNSELITGDIYLKFNQSNDLSLTKVFPETRAEARDRDDNYITFTLTGKNESTADVFYKIMLNEGEEKEGYDRLNTKDLRFDLVEINENNQEKMVVSDMSFASLNATTIYSSVFEAGINNNITRTYKLRMWVDDRVHISDTAYNADYPAKGEHAFKNHYASVKVSVKAESGRIKGYVRYNVNGEIQKQPIYEEQKTTIRQVSAPEGKINYEWSTNANGTGTKYKANAELNLNSDVTLYPIYINENVMNTFPSFVTNNKASIKEIYFNKSTDLARYNAAASNLKGDIATKGHVYTWLEQDPEDNLYRMYVESDGVTFLTTGQNLFKEYSKVTTIEFNNIDTSRLTSMNSMFYKCYKLYELDLSNFDTRNVENMHYSFRHCDSLVNLYISLLNTRNVTDMSQLFQECASLIELDVSHFDTSNVTTMLQMFQGCSSLTELDVSNFDIKNVVDISYMFQGCSGLTELDVSNFDTRNVNNMQSLFKACSGLTELDVSGFDTSNVTSMQEMFNGCSSLTELDVSKFNIKNVTSIGYMFNECSALIELDISDFDTRNVTDMSCVFSGCSSLIELDVSHFDTKNVTNMNCMFSGCSSLTELDVSGFNTSKVTDLMYMFSGCSNLLELDVSHFNTDNVTNMSYLFNGCSKLESLDVNNFNTKSVANMGYMFSGCNSLTELDVSSFDTSGVTDMHKMFISCTNLQKIYISNLWILKNDVISSEMFNWCTSLIGQNGTTIASTGNIVDATYAKVDEAGSPGYFWYKEA